MENRPAPMKQFFDDHLCPDCGGDQLKCWEDSGHDVCVTCQACGARFGLQLPPFNLIERLT